MPLLFKAIAVFLAMIVSGVVARALASIGIGIVIYNGVDILLDKIHEYVLMHFGSVGASIAQVLGLLGFDVFVSLILSAHAAVIASRLFGGAFVRLGFVARLVDQIKGA